MKELKLNLTPLIHKLDVVLKKGFSMEPMAGNYKSVFKGKGLEFEGYRNYDSNDDAMMIDWKASLRVGQPVVRQLREERNVNVFILFDISNSMLYSSHDRLKCEIAAEIAATLTYAILQVGDSIGFATFSDRIQQIIPPALGRIQYFRILQILSDPKNYGGKFDLGRVLEELLKVSVIQRNAIVFIISDFIGLKKKEWESQFEMASAKYDMNAIIVRDPTDRSIPNEMLHINMQDPYSKQQLIIDANRFAREYALDSERHLSKIKEHIKLCKATSLVIYTDQPFIKEIIKFFKARQGR